MAWLRIDDSFAAHPKIAALTDAQLRVWLRVLCYCARYKKTRGAILEAALVEVPGLTKSTLNRFRNLGLIDPEPEPEFDPYPGAIGYVHDWRFYNPDDATAADRMRRLRERKRNDDRNEERNNDRNKNVTVTVPRAPARARGPSPKDLRAAAAEQLGAAAAAADNLEDLRQDLAELGWNPTQIAAAANEPDRARAWLDRARADDVRAPGAFAWAGYQQGGWPAEPDKPKAPIIDVATNAVRMVLWKYDDEAIRDELGVMERRLGQTLETEQIDRLLELAAENRTEHATA